jgi:hypothetical protein
MKKIIAVSSLAVLALTMLLPVARPVNAASVNDSVLRQSGNPIPPGHGGGGKVHSILRQSGNPIPPGHGGGGK